MELTHFDPAGGACMVDVTEKPATRREAVAAGRVTMSPETLGLIMNRQLSKGDVLEVARLAGIMAAKRVDLLIPLCHQITLTGVKLTLEPDPAANAVDITARVRTSGPTGVEMEALTAVSVAALTIYDMCKAVDRAMVLGEIRLLEKSGGRSGHYCRDS
ncbi:MAG: cyclic pyranopterin monophosphate synthase MoaC [Magnetococcales bacterium]|nr:cyclic pyranopterin monophosphate synthase MoaC [Magnetococcales bacterium]